MMKVDPKTEKIEEVRAAIVMSKSCVADSGVTILTV